MVECGKEKTQDIQLKKGGNLQWKSVVHFRRPTFGLKGQRPCCVCLLSSSVLLCYSPPVFLSWAEVVIVSVPQHCTLWLDCFLCVIRQIYWTLTTKVCQDLKHTWLVLPCLIGVNRKFALISVAHLFLILSSQWLIDTFSFAEVTVTF